MLYPKWDSTYQERKAWRTEDYMRKHGKKLVICAACSGSGYYDDTGSPACASCNGTGKVREK